MSVEIASLSLAALLKLYKQKKLSPVEATQAALRQVLKYNSVVNALCFMDERAAIHQARTAEKRWLKGEPRGLLDGVTVTIKDSIHVRGWPTRFGSRTTADAKQQDDAPATARLRETGAVFIGKTTLPEYGHKGVTDSPLTGITRNPWNVEKTCGGSSGGAAVAAATGMAQINIGTDAGGSIRIPAAFTGVFGFKPSSGVVPAYPPSLFSSLSVTGPLTRTVEDAAYALDAISQPDLRDWHALPLPPMNFVKNLHKPLPKLRIGYALSIEGVSARADVRDIFARKLNVLKTLGIVEEIALDMPNLTETFSAHWMAVASYITAQMPPRQRKLMDARILDWAKRGDSQHLHDYLKAERDRMDIGLAFKNLLTTYDIIVTPAIAVTAFETGSNTPLGADGKPWFDWTPFTYPANLARIPACTLPCGLTKEGLPVGMQVMAGYLKDAFLLQVAARLEEALEFKPWLSRQES